MVFVMEMAGGTQQRTSHNASFKPQVASNLGHPVLSTQRCTLCLRSSNSAFRTEINHTSGSRSPQTSQGLRGVAQVACNLGPVRGIVKVLFPEPHSIQLIGTSTLTDERKNERNFKTNRQPSPLNTHQIIAKVRWCS